jgi:hypothetical protein
MGFLMEHWARTAWREYEETEKRAWVTYRRECGAARQEFLPFTRALKAWDARSLTRWADEDNSEGDRLRAARAQAKREWTSRKQAAFALYERTERLAYGDLARAWAQAVADGLVGTIPDAIRRRIDEEKDRF